MQTSATMPNNPAQQLPREAYVSDAWFEREKKELFSRTWAFAGVLMDYPNAGDFKTVQIGNHSIIVVKDADGELRAFHNVCRHRGTELLEGCGNAGKTIICPYHNWAYNLDGRLRGVPAQRECFPNMDKKSIALYKASVGVFNNLVFVHPEENPSEPFENWVANLESVPWPHDLASSEMEENPDDIVYELNCNWKVFFENAIDGYHLAYCTRRHSEAQRTTKTPGKHSAVTWSGGRPNEKA